MSWIDQFLTAITNVQDGGAPLIQRPAINFTGGGVSVADDPATKVTTVTVTSGGIPGLVPSRVVVSDSGGNPVSGDPLTSAATPSTVVLRDANGGTAIANLARAYESAPGITDALLYATGNGSTNDYAALVTAAGAAARLHWSAGTYKVATTGTIGAQSSIHSFEQGAVIHVPSGTTLTLAGSIDASENAQIFQVDAGGTLILTNYGQVGAHVGWFGADPVGNSDSTAAAVACANAINGSFYQGGHVQFGKGVYKLGAMSFTGLVGVKFRGAGEYATQLICTTLTGDWMSISGSEIVMFEDLQICLATLATIKTSGDFFNISGCTELIFERLRVVGQYGLFKCDTVGGALFRDVKVFGGSSVSNWSHVWHLSNYGGVWIDRCDVNMGDGQIAVTEALLLVDGGADTLLVSNTALNQVGTVNAAGVASIDTGTHIITLASALGAAANDVVRVYGQVQPGGVSASTDYYVDYIDATHMRLLTAPSGSVVPISSSGTSVVVNRFPTSGGTCVKFQNTNASFDPRWVYFSNVLCEAVNGVGFDFAAINQFMGVNCSVATSTIGIRVSAGNDIRFKHSFVIAIDQHAVQLTGGKRAMFEGCTVTGASRRSTGTYNCFSLTSTPSNVHIRDCSIGDSDTLGLLSYAAGYGIATSSGAGDDAVNHKFSDNVYGPLLGAPVFRGIQRTDYGTRFEAEKTSVPTDGTWVQGDIVWNLSAAAATEAGWICTASGTFGAGDPTFALIPAVAATPSVETANNAIVIRDTAGEIYGSTIKTPSKAAASVALRALGMAFFPGLDESKAASSGVIRTEKQAQVWNYQDTGGVTRTGLQIDGADDVQLGNSVNTTLVDGSSIQLRPGGTLALWVTSTVIQARQPISVDHIEEYTASAGVLIQGLQIDTSGNLPVKYRRKYIPWNKPAADALGTDALTEHVIFRTVEAITITGCKFEPDAGLTADNSNNAVLTLRKRDGAGGSATSMVANTTSVGGTGNWTAFVTVSLDAGGISSASIAAGGIVTFEITKNGAGVVIPSGTLIVDYTV